MIPDEQKTCARWLEIGSRVGLTLVVAGFVAYVTGLIEPLVPPAELARLWSLPVDRYAALTGAPTGWGWLQALGKGDYLNLLGIAVFASITAAAYARIVPDLMRRGLRLQATLAALQVVVLLIAASGILA